MSNKCSECCLDLCEVFLCDGATSLKLSTATAGNSGDYKLVLNYQGTARVYTQFFNIGESITFDIVNLNENFCYEHGFVVDKNNSIVLIDGYTCISFCTTALYTAETD